MCCIFSFYDIIELIHFCFHAQIKEAEEERKARIKEEQERAKEMERELENVPAWKREIMMKRGGAIKNWGDERENINEQVKK